MLDTHARKFVQPCLERLARLFIAIGLTPNIVTWTAFVVGVASGPLIAVGFTALAIGCFLFSGLLDTLDGTMARLQGTTSRWGGLMDITFDQIVGLAPILGLAIRFPEAQLPLLVLSAILVVSMTVFCSIAALSKQTSSSKSFHHPTGIFERGEEVLFLTLMMAIPTWLVNIAVLFSIAKACTTLSRLKSARTEFFIEDHNNK